MAEFTAARDALIAEKRDVSSEQRLIDELGVMVGRARERDAIQASRPDGCWCLGDGGRGPRYIPSMDDEPVRSFEEFCGCPDGTAAEARAGQARRSARQARDRHRLAALFAEARLPARFSTITFDTYPVDERNAETVEYLKWWIAGPPGGDDDPGWDAWIQERRQSLYLFGPFGTGKTGLAISALKRFMGTTLEAGLFLTVPSLLDRIRRTYDGGEVSEHEVLDLVKTVPLLVLDDLGTERVTDWVAERLFVVVNARHDDDLPTIFTSNLSPEQLAVHIGERIAWRVIEMSEVVRLEGPNLRDRKA